MADGNITVEVSTQAAQAELERLRELVRWAYTKLHSRTFSSMDDALKLDEMKLLLEHGI